LKLSAICCFLVVLRHYADHKPPFGRIRRKIMAKATSISLSQFTATVQAAVKAAVQKHPKFKIDPPQAVAVSYLIRGIPPVEESRLANVTLGEVQAFANDIAAHIGTAQPEALVGVHGASAQGVLYSDGRHIIIGIPAPPDYLLEK
jgi:hypothetical protein